MSRDQSISYTELVWIKIKLPQQCVMQNSNIKFNNTPIVFLKAQHADEQTQLMCLFYDLCENNLNRDRVIYSKFCKGKLVVKGR
jgi:hypothetical protein